MASTSVASRSDRHYHVDPDDRATQRAMAFAAWAKRNRTMIIAAAVIALVLVAGILYYRYDQARQRADASAAYMSVQQAAETAGNPAAVTRQLTNFIAAHSGTPEAAEARLALAEIHLRGNEPQKAIEVLREPAAGSSPLAVQAAMLLGAAQAEAGQREAAIQTYTQAAERAEAPYLRNEALTEAALVYEQAGNWKGAAELYRRVVDASEKGTMDRTIAEMRLTEAEARAGGR